MGTIRVRVAGEEAELVKPEAANGRELTGHFVKEAGHVIPFSTAELAASLRELSGQLGELFSAINPVNGFELQQIELSLELSAEGGFNLIGSAKVGSKGAITLSFAPGNKHGT